MTNPVAVFGYVREAELARTMGSLRASRGFEGRPIHLFIDGPKGSADAERVDAVRRFAEGLGWPNLEVHASAENRGLRQSVMAGVTQLVERYGTAIVIEDDLQIGPLALEYFDAGLERFAGEERVKAVCGYMYKMEAPADDRAFFLPFANSWGWATWRRAWMPFAGEAAGLTKLADDAGFLRAFDRQGIIAASDMLRAQRDGLIDSWAILWNAHIARTGGVSLFPHETMILNEGFATRGATHGSRFNPINHILGLVNANREYSESFSLPATVAVEEARRRAVAASTEARLYRLSSHLGHARRRLMRAIRSHR